MTLAMRNTRGQQFARGGARAVATAVTNLPLPGQWPDNLALTGYLDMRAKTPSHHDWSQLSVRDPVCRSGCHLYGCKLDHRRTSSFSCTPGADFRLGPEHSLGY